MTKKGKDIFLTMLVSTTLKDLLLVMKLRLLNTPIAAQYWITLNDISKRKEKAFLNNRSWGKIMIP